MRSSALREHLWDVEREHGMEGLRSSSDGNRQKVSQEIVAFVSV